MITHSVIFTLNHPTESEEATAFWIAAKSLAGIPGVNKFECLKQTNVKNKFDFGLSMEFENQEDYDNYSNHPEHVDFIKNFWIKDVKEFLEIDYEKFEGR